MAIKLASLFIEIGAKGDKLLVELSRTSKRTGIWSKSIDKSTRLAKIGFASVTAAAVTYTAVLASLYKSTSQSVTQQAKLNARLATTYQNTKILGVTARQAGIDQEGLNDTLADFTERLGEAAIDGGEPAEAMKLLGVEVDALRRLDPALALREVLEAMEALPDAGARAATGAKLFGDEGIKITGLLSEQFDLAAAKIESLGGSLSEIEVQQIKDASAAVGDIRLAAELASDRLTAKLAPGVELVARQMFEAAKQNGQFERTMDTLIVSGLSGLSDFSESMAKVLGFVESREEILEYGVLGFMLFGRKGALVGGLLGAVSNTVEMNLNAVRGFFDETLSERDALIIELQGLETVLANSQENTDFLGDTVGGFINNLFYDDVATLESEIERVETRLIELGEPIDKSGGFIGSLSDIMQDAADAARTLAENYGQATAELVKPISTADNKISLESDEPTIEDLTGYFEQQSAMRLRFQKTWTDFQAAGARDRLSIFASETSGSLATLSQFSKTFFKINKAMGNANAVINIGVGITNAFRDLPFPASLAAAAKIALEGAAALRSINSAQPGSGAAPGVNPGSAPEPISSVTSGSAVSSPAANEGNAQGQSNVTQYFIVSADEIIDPVKFRDRAVNAVTEASSSQAILFNPETQRIESNTEAA